MRTKSIALWANSADELATLTSAFKSVFGGSSIKLAEPTELVYEVSGQHEERYAGFREVPQGMSGAKGPSRFMTKALFDKAVDTFQISSQLNAVARLASPSGQDVLIFGSAISLSTPKNAQAESEPEPAAAPVAA